MGGADATHLEAVPAQHVLLGGRDAVVVLDEQQPHASLPVARVASPVLASGRSGTSSVAQI
jgi:hypothetical protein